MPTNRDSQVMLPGDSSDDDHDDDLDTGPPERLESPICSSCGHVSEDDGICNECAKKARLDQAELPDAAAKERLVGPSVDIGIIDEVEPPSKDFSEALFNSLRKPRPATKNLDGSFIGIDLANDRVIPPRDLGGPDRIDDDGLPLDAKLLPFEVADPEFVEDILNHVNVVDEATWFVRCISKSDRDGSCTCGKEFKKGESWWYDLKERGLNKKSHFACPECYATKIKTAFNAIPEVEAEPGNCQKCGYTYSDEEESYSPARKRTEYSIKCCYCKHFIASPISRKSAVIAWNEGYTMVTKKPSLEVSHEAPELNLCKCGHAARIVNKRGNWPWQIQCSDSGCPVITPPFRSKDNAIKRWQSSTTTETVEKPYEACGEGMVQMRACPFCGTLDLRLTEHTDEKQEKTFWVQCKGNGPYRDRLCSTYGPHETTKAKAIEAWTGSKERSNAVQRSWGQVKDEWS